MIKKLFRKIVDFAKRRPSAFIVIVIAIVFCLLLITYEALHLTSTPAFCSICHKDAESGPGGEYYTWKKNIHAYVNVGCIDCHGKPGLFGYIRAKMGGMYDLYSEIFHSRAHKLELLTKGATDQAYAIKLVPNEWCSFCHSDEVNKQVRSDTIMSFLGLKMRYLDKVVNPKFREKYGLPDVFNGPITGVDPNHKKHVNELGLSCLNCHSGVAHSGDFITLTKMSTCFKCHDEKRAAKEGQTMPDNDDCVKCHKLSLDIQKGEFLEDKGIKKTPWNMPSITGECSSCHEDANTPPTAQSCVNCHDESYTDIYMKTRSDFEVKKINLKNQWLELFKYINKMNSKQTAQFNELSYYYKLIFLDRSEGIHNKDLMNKIFEKADGLLKELQAGLIKKK